MLQKNTFTYRLTIFLLFIGICENSACKSLENKGVSISFKLDNYDVSHIIIGKHEGFRYTLVDTLHKKTENTFTNASNKHLEPGMYFFLFPEHQSIEIPFIINNEDIFFNADFSKLDQSITVTESKENKIYYNFLKAYEAIQAGFSRIEHTYDYALAHGEPTTTISFMYNDLIKEEQDLFNNIEESYSESIAMRYIHSSRIARPSSIVSKNERDEFKKSHFLQHIDFSDTLLLSSKIISSACLQYLLLYAQTRTTENQYAPLQQAVDSIIHKVIMYPKTYTYVISYLLHGFQQMQNYVMMEYISQHFIEQTQCEDSENPETLERKALQITRLSKGKDVPEFSVLCSENNKINNLSIASGTHVLIFWASWCSHCTMIMPYIIDFYEQNPHYNLIFISLDYEIEDAKKYIQENPKLQEFTHIFDGQEWDGELARTFYIYGSPTFIITHNNTIVSIPSEIHEYFSTINSLQNSAKE